MSELVLDATVLTDLLVGGAKSALIRERLTNHALHAPAHIDADVVEALELLAEQDLLTPQEVDRALSRLQAAPITRHELASLAQGAWLRRESVPVDSAFYVELAERLNIRLVTLDERLSASATSEVLGGAS